jgi:hypothetical protein
MASTSDEGCERPIVHRTQAPCVPTEIAPVTFRPGQAGRNCVQLSLGWRGPSGQRNNCRARRRFQPHSTALDDPAAASLSNNRRPCPQAGRPTDIGHTATPAKTRAPGSTGERLAARERVRGFAETEHRNNLLWPSARDNGQTTNVLRPRRGLFRRCVGLARRNA